MRVEEGGFERALTALMVVSATLVGALAMEFFNLFTTPPTRWLYEQVRSLL
jgi:hypothetical protein